MDGVIGMDEARALVGNAALWPRVRDFLWDFAGQVHPSWLADLENLEPLAGLERRTDLLRLDSPRVRRFILAQLEVAPCFHAFPKDDGSRLLLLDAATLEGVARWLGALACAGELRRITGGAAVRALKAALPGIYPEVFGYVAYFSGFDVPRGDAAENLLDDVVRTGYALLHSAVSSLPEPLLSRLKCKLPKQEALRLGAMAPNKLITQATIQKLLKLKFPEAYSLCCS